MEQWVNLKFHVKFLGKTVTKAYAMLKEVYGHGCLSRTQVFERLNTFKEGREMTEDIARLGRPYISKTDANIQQVSQMIRENRHLKPIAELTGIEKYLSGLV